MTFLPIVDRELRLASRKAWTFWVRVTAAGVAMFIASGFLFVAVAEAAGTAQLGGPLFNTLAWMSLAGALSVGLFFTSDCLSEEKREGTLGFLFLTDLRGYDVVLGKLLAASLRCVFGLLAVFPILAITQLMGGVEPTEFWQTLLALMHAMFFSLATGMFVSAISRNGQKAMSGTLLLLILFLAGGPAIDAMLAKTGGTQFRPLLSLTSPGYVFISAGRGMGLFWDGLLPSQATAWLMLAVSCVLIRHNWQEKSSKSSATAMRWRYWWKYGSEKRRMAFRSKLLTKNPVFWLASRERWQRVAVWIVCGAVVIGYAALFVSPMGREFWFVWRYLTGLVSLVLYLWVAAQSCQFFVDARRSGLMELLLATPLSSHEMVRGAWRALVRTFALPIGLYLAVQILATILNLSLGWDPVNRLALGFGTGWWVSISGVLSGIISATITFANLITLAWFGMWMAMISRNARMATLKTITFVQIIPWFVMTFAVMVATPLLILPALAGQSGGNTTWFVWYPLVTGAITLLITLSKDALFFFWARKKLANEFREMAVRVISPVRRAAAPGIPIAPPLPPMSPAVPAPPVMNKP
jgi:ABC-type transport system involved in multi-copper enzyme maturation permease subunit